MGGRQPGGAVGWRRAGHLVARNRLPLFVMAVAVACVSYVTVTSLSIAALQRRANALLNAEVTLADARTSVDVYRGLGASIVAGLPPTPLRRVELAGAERDAARLFAPRRTLPGVDLREEAQVALFGKLAALSRADPLPAGPEAGTRYFTDNPNYGVGDASILQAMLRHLRPRRYLEVGSGWSTALALDTSERFLGGTLSVTAIEPYPDLLRDRLRPGDPVTILEAPVQSVPLSRFEELEAGDVLFVDSSHVLKTASDVHFLYTAVLPVLAPGVVVHVHDMFWPFEYLRHWIEEGRAWNECYLVHAFLAHNDAYEVLLFNHFLAQVRPEVLDAELPVMRDNPGGALWLRRRTD